MFGDTLTYALHGGPFGLDRLPSEFLRQIPLVLHIQHERFRKVLLGIGAGVYGLNQSKTNVAAYIPLGIGFKWKFSTVCGLNIAWQHNIYMADNLEGRDALDNKHQLNGWNWMNCDLTGMFTVGIVFEFARAKKECRICNY